jgi:hypothetical protein
MSFFGSIAHFFSSLFGKNSTVVQNVLHDVSSFVNLAEPIVAGIETELKTLPNSPQAAQIAAFLEKYAPVGAQVGQIAGNLSQFSGPTLWAQVAQTALSFIVPSGTAANLINLAVELAYSTFKQIQAAKAAAAPAVTTTVAATATLVTK